MVFDTLKNAPLYHGLGSRFKKALEWLCAADHAAMESGIRMDIDGDDIYATYFDIDTLPRDQSKLEAHRNYADIQCLLDGRELVGYAPIGTMPAISDYEPDIQFFNGDWETLSLRPGSFYIVWPQDLHAPRVADGDISRVRRMVVKVRL